MFHTVACINEHPQYKMPYYDFAILTLDEPVDITSTDSKARAACLPTNTSKLYDNGELMTVSGWGSTIEGQSWDELPSVLHHVQLPGVNNAACADNYILDVGITDEMMCAGLVEGGIGVCHGDAGGILKKCFVFIMALHWFLVTHDITKSFSKFMVRLPSIVQECRKFFKVKFLLKDL